MCVGVYVLFVDGPCLCQHRGGNRYTKGLWELLRTSDEICAVGLRLLVIACNDVARVRGFGKIVIQLSDFQFFTSQTLKSSSNDRDNY